MPVGPPGQKRPADTNACAVHVCQIATGEIEEALPTPQQANALSGRAGGHVRAHLLKPSEAFGDRPQSGAGALPRVTASEDLTAQLNGCRFSTVLADPPWRFSNRTGKVAPEHRRLSRYPTLSLDEIADLPVERYVRETAHCYLWVPNALLPDGLRVLEAWGSTLQDQPDLAEGPQGRWAGRPGGGFYIGSSCTSD